MKNRTFFIILLITIISLVLFVSFFVIKKNQGVTRETLRIGAAIAITGYGSDFGQSEKNAISMLKEKFKDDNVEFFIEDTKSDTKAGLAAINKLVNVDKCDIIYCELSSIVNAANSFLMKNKITLIAPVYVQSLSDNPYAIRNLPSADQENKALIDYLMQNGIESNKIGILYSNDVFGKTCKESFSKLLPQESDISFSLPINDESLKELAVKSVSSAPDVIYIGSMSESVGLLIRHLRMMGYKKTIVTTDAFAYDYINSLAGEYAKGTFYIDFQKNDLYSLFQNNYKEKFKTESAPSAMLCYDGISIAINVWKTGVDINDYSYDGLTGKILVKNNEIIYPIEVLQWK